MKLKEFVDLHCGIDPSFMKVQITLKGERAAKRIFSTNILVSHAKSLFGDYDVLKFIPTIEQNEFSQCPQLCIVIFVPEEQEEKE